MDTREPDLATKVDFLNQVYSEWEDGTAYREEPINSFIKAQDMTRAFVVLLVSEWLELETGGDMEWYITRAYDRIIREIDNDNV